VAIASGSKHPAIIPSFTAAVVLTWGWLSSPAHHAAGGRFPRAVAFGYLARVSTMMLLVGAVGLGWPLSPAGGGGYGATDC
jgi:hypothetical protein